MEMCDTYDAGADTVEAESDESFIRDGGLSSMSSSGW